MEAVNKVFLCIWKTFISHVKPGYFCDFIYLHMFNARHFDSYILSDAMYTVELSRVITNFPSEQSAHFIMEEVFTKINNQTSAETFHTQSSSGFLPPKLYINITGVCIVFTATAFTVG